MIYTPSLYTLRIEDVYPFTLTYMMRNDNALMFNELRYLDVCAVHNMASADTVCLYASMNSNVSESNTIFTNVKSSLTVIILSTL